MIIKTHLTHFGYHININTITNNIHKQIISDLTVMPYILDATPEESEASKFKLYRYSKNKTQIIVPRYYGISKFGKPNKKSFDPEDIDIEFKKELRKKQKIVVDKCVKYMLKNGGGLLSVPCGFGKTVCALYIAYKLGLKTLVVVHKSFLLEQWINRAKEFLDITDKQIGIIRQHKCDYSGKDIVIGMIHTIAKRKYKDVFKTFGLVIYDEAHHVACKFFSRALLKTSVQHTLALTATPYRGDGLIKVMYWFAGGTIYREKAKMNKNVIVKMIYYRSSDKKLFVEKKRWLKGKLRSDTCKMINNICKINSRNNKIIEIITHIRRNEPERKILVLSGRKTHLDIIKKGVDGHIKIDINNKIIDNNEIYSCYYTGDTKPSERKEAEERGDIIFATYDMANEGLDIKHLNTVILASPKKDIIQSTGRIMRTILKSGDCRPMIIDISDELSTIRNWINTRKYVYDKSKYEINNYYICDNKFITSLEYYGIKLTNEDIHHKNYFINKAINDYNKDLLEYQNDIKKFRNICMRFDNSYNINDYYHNELENIKCKILDELEPVNLKDILYVEKLTEDDFDKILLKDAENHNEINIDEDIELDKETEEQFKFLLRKKINNRPKKSLFK